MTEPILTRYLYLKAEVERSLVWAILDHDECRALFWGYELYFSGFDQEVILLLISIANTYYIENHHDIITVFETWSHKHYDQDCIVASMIKTMIKMSPSITHLCRGHISTDKSQHTNMLNTLYILANRRDIEPYMTVETERAWQLLRKVCRYSYSEKYLSSDCITNAFGITSVGNIHRNDNDNDDDNPNCILDTENWPYYASHSPIWRRRILEYGGRIDEHAKCIVFACIDAEESFYNKYDCEPDEQSSEIRHRIWSKPCTMEHKIMSWSDFCHEYSKNGVFIKSIRIRNPRNNLVCESSSQTKENSTP
jgi:hypothetical protein